MCLSFIAQLLGLGAVATLIRLMGLGREQVSFQDRAVEVEEERSIVSERRLQDTYSVEARIAFRSLSPRQIAQTIVLLLGIIVRVCVSCTYGMLVSVVVTSSLALFTGMRRKMQRLTASSEPRRVVLLVHRN